VAQHVRERSFQSYSDDALTGNGRGGSRRTFLLPGFMGGF